MTYPPAHQKGPARCTYGADGTLPWPTTILSVKPRMGRGARGRVAQDGWLYTVWSRDG